MRSQRERNFFFVYHSLRNAIAGSFFAAILDGINPANILSKMLIANITRHCHQDIDISPPILNTTLRIALPANENITLMIMPISPEAVAMARVVIRGAAEEKPCFKKI